MLRNSKDMFDRSEFDADPFSDLIRLAGACPTISGGFVAGGDWALRFPAPDALKFFAVIKGGCWLKMEGEDDPTGIEQGDVILITAQRPFVLGSDLSILPLDAVALFADKPDKTAKLGEPEECVQVGGHVRLDAVTEDLLRSVLPPLVHVRSGSPYRASLEWLLRQLVWERASGLPGALLAARQIAEMIFVQILRAYIAEGETLPPGFLRAAGDSRLAPALQLIHGDPSHSWRLPDLARAAGMSRTAFAVYFRLVAGMPPLTYLGEWRISLAKRALLDGATSLRLIARQLGYSSESAFSNAFKREVGVSPTHYRRSLCQGALSQRILAKRKKPGCSAKLIH
jgi:AraC-like DNA-binding protein